MFNNNESQFDPSFKHSSRYSQTAARYGKAENGPRGSDVENGNWAAQQQSMNLMQNAPPAINTGRGNGDAHAGAASGSYTNTNNNIKITTGRITGRTTADAAQTADKWTKV